MNQGSYVCSHKSLNENYIRLDRENSGEPPGVTDKNRKYKSVDQRGYDFSNFIGSSASMKKVFEIIEKVAETKTTVLISGQSGTGKEMVARSIHSNSSRRREPFVAINCGCSDTAEAPSQGRIGSKRVCLKRLKKGLFFWTKSVSCLWVCRLKYSGLFRKKRFAGLEKAPAGRLIYVS
ncbi:MAG: sigma 54-interacting transcriptional regulator [Deltaproteobacteria bacterium]|nr:sigma 54-interacting transcriptional regulator [Deltaproteobacteria bacterium]